MSEARKMEETRAKLQQKEAKLWSEIDHESKNINKALNKGLKWMSIIGTSLFVGYSIFRIIDFSSKKK